MVTLASSNNANLFFVRESVIGTTPTSPTLQQINFNDANFNFNLTNVQSNTIRADRNRGELINVEKQAGGGFTSELQFQAYDSLWESAMYNTYTSPLTVTDTDISFADADNSANSAGAGFPAFVIAQWINVSGTSSNEGLLRVSKTVAPTTSKIVFETSSDVTTESAGASMTLENEGTLKNGVTKFGNTFVIEHSTITQFFDFVGMVNATWNVNIAQGEIPTQRMDFVGFSSLRDTTQISGASEVVPSTAPFINPVDNIGSLRVDGVELTNTGVTGLTFEMNNNAVALFALGGPTALDVVEGSFDLRGSFRVYFADGVLYDKFVNSSTVSLDFPVTDNNGDILVFTVDNFKFDTFPVDIGGLNQQIVVDATYVASIDPTLDDRTFQIDKIKLSA